MRGTLRGMHKLSSEAALSKLFCLPSEKTSTIKLKEFAPLEANPFILV